VSVRLSSFSFFFISLAGARDQNNKYVTKNVTGGGGLLYFLCLDISTAQRTNLRMQKNIATRNNVLCIPIVPQIYDEVTNFKPTFASLCSASFELKSGPCFLLNIFLPL
jgi:hypothetical protein